MLNQKNKYNPDVLDCLANLSNDEVFTSPELANKILDELPQELFSNKNTKFLDPCSKSGIFLREIVKRLNIGLEKEIPDEQERIDHICHNQVYGVAITPLTALLSRRTVYCSKYACAMNNEIWISDDNDTAHGIHQTHSYSISEFTDADVNNFCINPIQGNIRFNAQCKHDYSNSDICPLCGANKKQNSEYSHAYEFIHMNDEELEDLKNMNWDVIIGNPPYQMSADNTSDKPIYQNFVEQAKKLEPRYLSMIIPSRWMTSGKGLDAFRDIMIHDKHITKLVDYVNSQDCFNGVDIKDGVCYFLREKDKEDKCEIITYDANGEMYTGNRYLASENDIAFIRLPLLASIKEKVVNGDAKFVGLDTIVYAESAWRISKELSFDEPIEFGKLGKSARSFFASNVFSVLSNKVFFDNMPQDGENYICLYGRNKGQRCCKYIKAKYVDMPSNGDKYKVLIPKANGSGAIGEVLSTPLVGQPLVGHTQTFISIGCFDNEIEANNLLKYIKSKFMRAMLGTLKITQDNKKDVWRYVPIQNFTNNSDIDWSKSVHEIDEQLYKKYKLTNEEIQFIENNIQEMK